MKQYNRVPYSFFEETLKKLDKNPGELCEALGYGRNAYLLWKKKMKKCLPSPHLPAKPF